MRLVDVRSGVKSTQRRVERVVRDGTSHRLQTITQSINDTLPHQPLIGAARVTWYDVHIGATTVSIGQVRLQSFSHLEGFSYTKIFEQQSNNIAQ